tara:strand:+ start:740 stop:1087 length:348 start_codon:yes stop_codon:yes gene_type:complete
MNNKLLKSTRPKKTQILRFLSLTIFNYLSSHAFLIVGIISLICFFLTQNERYLAPAWLNQFFILISLAYQTAVGAYFFGGQKALIEAEVSFITMFVYVMYAGLTHLLILIHLVVL